MGRGEGRGEERGEEGGVLRVAGRGGEGRGEGGKIPFRAMNRFHHGRPCSASVSTLEREVSVTDIYLQSAVMKYL